MHSLIKTALIAAVGAAVVSASPALAASKRSDRALVYGGVYGYAPAYGSVFAPGPFIGDPGAAQIVNEYLKDTPMHNGNAY